MTNIKYKLVVEQDGKDVLVEELGFRQVRGIVENFGRWGDPANPKLTNFLSMNADVEIRQRVADWNGLSDEVLKRLSQDTIREVRSNLIDNDSFRSWVSTELLIDYIKLDADIAGRIACNVEQFSDPKALCDVLLSRKEPQVRRALAENQSAPKAVAKKLSKDEDFSVRTAALETIRNN